MRDQKPNKETLDQWHNDPSNWVWGFFYYNQADKRLLPPKRIRQMGWTVNFGNPASVLFFIVMFAFAGLLIATAIHLEN